MSESPTDPDPNSPSIPQIIPEIIHPDSGDSDGYYSETETLDASISDYRKEYGRTYHRYKEGSYPFPNDLSELERLDDQHEIFKQLFKGKLHMSPLIDPQRILDIGTGTGRWAVEMGDMYPRAKIIGTDLAPTQPENVPDNVYFEIEDCSEEDWCRENGSIDLIHASMMIGSLESYRKLVKTSYQYIKPGNGWLECWDLLPTPKCDDDTMTASYGFAEWESLAYEAGVDRLEPPRSIRYAHKISSYLRSAGFVDIQEQIYKLPLNSWPSDHEFKEIGVRWGQMMLDGISGFTYKFMGAEGWGWSKHEIEVWLTGIRNAMKDRSVHAYQTLYVVWGRRPSEEEEPEVQRRLAQRKAEKQAKKESSSQPAAGTDSAAFTGPPSGTS